MKFKGLDDFTHTQEDKIGVLITNLGTPDGPTPQALRVYLRQFLSDPRVVEIPRLIWLIILHGIILRIRPKKSAKAYASVWTEHGSPLLSHTQEQAKALSKRLETKWGDKLVTKFAMRYGNPSIDKVMNSMLEEGARRLVILPLYPQYSGATAGSTFDAISTELTARRWVPELRFINSYHDHPLYIKAMADKIKQFCSENGQADKLMLSFHGVPKRYLELGDPYYCHCQVTSRLLTEALDIDADKVITSFQSRFGKAEWLKPYTDHTLKSLPDKGVSSVQVFCPGFSSDCLETLEEIAVENRDYFLEAGGQSYQYIPALNSDRSHIDLLESIIDSNLQGWEVKAQDYQARERRFKGCPLHQ
ncbi:ferrochelatase [Oleiphilus sp. HI0085]|nr:ferrochelatase [Oleiphilus sp. HI0085]